MSEPSDRSLVRRYPQVSAFAKRMRAELWANRHKGDRPGWLSMSNRQAWGEIAWHLGKLAGALKAQDRDLILELCADIANGALMLDDMVRTRGPVDVCRCGIPVDEPSPGCAWHEQRDAT